MLFQVLCVFFVQNYPRLFGITTILSNTVAKSVKSMSNSLLHVATAATYGIIRENMLEVTLSSI
jgi:hypothetical protein